jgi:hypothetical protein
MRINSANDSLSISGFVLSSTFAGSRDRAEKEVALKACVSCTNGVNFKMRRNADTKDRRRPRATMTTLMQDSKRKLSLGGIIN